MNKYTFEEVFNETLKYFNNDELATKVFIDKYCLKDSENNLYELNPNDTIKRVSLELERIEQKYPNPISYDTIYSLLSNFKYIVPQGGPLNGIGNDFQYNSLSNCFTEDNYVLTINGNKKIKDVKIGDLVLTHKGNWKPVVNTLQRKYTGKINKYYDTMLSTDIKCTLEHPFYNGNEIWTKSIDNNELCVLTKENNNNEIYIVDLLNYINEDELKKHNKELINENNILQLKTNFVGGNNIKSHKFTNKINRFIPINIDVAYLLGRFIGDGSIYNDHGNKSNKSYLDGFNIVFNKNEQSSLNKLKIIFESNIGLNINISGNLQKYNYNYLRTSSEILCNFLSTEFGVGYANKKIPAFIFNSNNDIIYNFLLGIFDADGMITSDGAIRLTMSNESLINDIQSLLYILNIPNRKRLFKTKSKYNDSFSICINNYNSIELRKNMSKYYIDKRQTCIGQKISNLGYYKRDNELFIKYFKKDTIDYDGIVYNLSVLDDESYIINNVKTHNCFVIGNESDSYGGILLTDQEQVQLMKRRGGVGHNLSHIRPKGTPVMNSAITSTGIVPFMERFSNSTREVAQDGRRGALMLSIDIKSIESEDFINAKLQQDKITGANISVKVNDEFMNCVKNDTDYIQRFPINDTTHLDEEFINNIQYNKIIRLENGLQIKKISAKKLFDKLIHNNWKSAEPGILFWDNIIKNSTADNYEGFKTISTNPCFSGNTFINVKQNNNEFTIKIKELVERFNNNEKFEILSFNNKTNKLEYKQLLNGLLTKKNAEVITIQNSFTQLTVTPEHEIYTQNRGKVQAKDLNSNDILFQLLEQHNNNHLKVFDIISDKVLNIIKNDIKEDVYDITVKDNHNLFANGSLSSNCGEIPLCSYDSCRLLLINLYNYVENKFTVNAKFNFELFKQHVIYAQRFMDDIIDLEIEKIDRIINKINSDPEDEFTKLVELNLWNKIKEKAVLGRRTGTGITALGDMIASLNLKFGTDEANNMIEEIFKIKAIYEHKSSVILASERGTFPIYDKKLEKNDNFINFILSLDEELFDLHNKYGRRNIAISTISPAGSISIQTQTTSGIEPLFMPFYKRRKKINPNDKNNSKITTIDQNGDAWEEYNIIHKGLKDYYFINKELFNFEHDNIDMFTDEQLNMIYELSPYYNATASTIDYIKGVEMQGICQRYISHSISRTGNLPEDVSEQTISELYLKAWELGCKGFTIYREGSRTGVLVNNKEKEVKDIININNAPKRPKELDTNVIRFVNNKEQWIGVIGLLNGQPYELFTGKLEDFPIPNYVDNGVVTKIKDNGHGSRYDFIYKDKQGYEITMQGLNRVFDREVWNYAKFISALLRHGVPIIYLNKIVDSLKFENDIENIMTNWKRGVMRLLKKFIKDGEKSTEKCPECGEPLIYKDGCVSCIQCSWSKCS